MLIAALGTSVAASQTYTVDSLTAWSIGTIAAATSGTTVVLNATNGFVQVMSGSGTVMSGPYAFETVSIKCVDQGLNLCLNPNNKARIQVVRTGVNTGRAQTITAMGADSGTATVGAGTTSSNATLDFQLSGWTASNQVLTFKLGCYLPISGDDGAGSTGPASSQYAVYAAAYPNTPTVGLTGVITATVRRGMSLTKVSDLRFGTMIAPTSGTNYVRIRSDGGRDQADGSGNLGAGTVILVPSSYGTAQLTAKGEPGTTFSLSIPSTITMSGPGASINVTVQASPSSGTQTMPAGGSMSLVIGGYIPVSAGQASGNYSGSFTVTIAYN